MVYQFFYGHTELDFLQKLSNVGQWFYFVWLFFSFLLEPSPNLVRSHCWIKTTGPSAFNMFAIFHLYLLRGKKLIHKNQIQVFVNTTNNFFSQTIVSKKKKYTKNPDISPYYNIFEPRVMLVELICMFGFLR
jgi:hypothetical protein